MKHNKIIHTGRVTELFMSQGGWSVTFLSDTFLWLFLTVTSSFLNKYCYILFSLFLHLSHFCLSFETQIKGNLACDTRTALSPFSISTAIRALSTLFYSSATLVKQQRGQLQDPYHPASPFSPIL